MSTETSSIDDILNSQGGVKAPEMPLDIQEPDESSSNESHEQTFDYGVKELDDTGESHEDVAENATTEPQDDTDDYGNAKPKPRTYTEEEVNEKINKAVRERLSRGNFSDNPATNQQIQQQAKDFEYDPDSGESWQAQLASFVEETVSNMGKKEATKQRQQQEEAAHFELQQKIQSGIDRFSDFRETVGSQPVTDHMTHALRGMADPAAFIYAASKRMPAELQRISQIRDPYAQIVEMGKLEERMRQAKPTTKAPRPISRSQDDGIPIKRPEKREETIEDMIAASDAKRRAALNARRGR